MTHKIGDKDFNIIDSWDDLLLWQYIELSKLTKPYDRIKLTEIICGVEDLDELMIDEFNVLCQLVIDKTNSLPDIKGSFELKKSFIINDVLYLTRDVKSLNEMTAGEYSSLKTLQENWTGQPLDFIPTALAILIRPGKELIDEETKESYFEIMKFNRMDIKNLEFRANLFLKFAKGSDTIPVYNFFLNMKGNLKTTFPNSSKLKQKQKDITSQP